MVKKSELQIRLENEGWRLLTNDDPSHEFTTYGDIRSIPTKGDIQLIEDYLGKGFNEVRIEEAYDIYGEPVKELRAIYVKGNPRKISLEK